MNNYTLLIIDMQSQYPAACSDKTTEEIILQIEAAKQNDCGIILVEFREEPQYRESNSPYKPTHVSILKAVEGYNRAAVVHKYETDGSAYINDFLEKKGKDFNTDFFRVCGVNTDICVAQTVNGLYENFYKEATFIIVEDAVNTDNSLTVCKYGKMVINGKYNPYIAFNPDARIKFL
jgi:nicotinamidase-related amidase